MPLALSFREGGTSTIVLPPLAILELCQVVEAFHPPLYVRCPRHCGDGQKSLLLVTVNLKVPPDAKILWSVNKPLKFLQL